MRRARRAVGRRQKLDPEDALRQLCRRCRARSSSTHHGQLVDLATASPRTVLQLRRDTIGYVSQFLRTVPRVSALDVVAEPLVSRGDDREAARDRAREPARPAQPARAALGACRRPPSPAASSSASTSRAASSPPHPVLLLDEPTASLDADQPRSGDRADRRQEARRASRCSASSTTPTCARRSPTASST